MSRDSDYVDGYAQGTADVRAGRPYDDRPGSKTKPWSEGYRDGYKDHAKPKR